MFIFGVIGVDCASRACLTVLNTRGADGARRSPASHPRRRAPARRRLRRSQLGKIGLWLWFANIVSCFLRLCILRPQLGRSPIPAKSVCSSLCQFFDLARFLCAVRGKGPRQLPDIGNTRSFFNIPLAAVFECVQDGLYRGVRLIHSRCSTPGDCRGKRA